MTSSRHPSAAKRSKAGHRNQLCRQNISLTPEQSIAATRQYLRSILAKPLFREDARTLRDLPHWRKRDLPGEAQPCRGSVAFARGLIEHGVALEHRRERIDIAWFGNVEHVEARAHQKQELVPQDLAGSTQLAMIVVALPQQPRLTVGAAVLEAGEDQCHQGQAVEVRR